MRPGSDQCPRAVFANNVFDPSAGKKVDGRFRGELPLLVTVELLHVEDRSSDWGLFGELEWSPLDEHRRILASVPVPVTNCQSNSPLAESFVGGSGALLLSIARGSRRSSRGKLGSGDSNVFLLRRHIPLISINQRAVSVTNLVAVLEDKWQTAVRQFTVLKRLLEMDGIERTRAAVEKVAKILKKHPATIYRWIESYNCSGRLSELLRKNRADRGKSRLSSKVDTIIEDAIKKIYLTAEQPHISAVIEEVNLQCFKAGLKKPAANTVRRRIATLSDRLKLEKRKGKKAAAEK